MIELGAGFDMDLTARENIYLNGAVLGYSKEFIDQKFNEIVEFSELQDFLNVPVRNFSSGMVARLAFSIATIVDPEILIVDEILSVGDIAFQQKSENKMKEIISNGVTVILVSHSLGQIRELCNKVLWLDHGEQITFSADVNKVCDAYSEFLITKELPASDKDIDELALAYEKRMAEEKARKDKKETKKLEKILAQGTKNTAIEAALDIIETNAPEMLDMHEVGEWRRRNNG